MKYEGSILERSLRQQNYSNKFHTFTQRKQIYRLNYYFSTPLYRGTFNFSAIEGARRIVKNTYNNNKWKWQRKRNGAVLTTECRHRDATLNAGDAGFEVFDDVILLGFRHADLESKTPCSHHSNCHYTTAADSQQTDTDRRTTAQIKYIHWRKTITSAARAAPAVHNLCQLNNEAHQAKNANEAAACERLSDLSPGARNACN